MPVNLSFTHLIVVAIVALVVLGPERLPGVARTAGNLYREWQRVKGGLEGEVREALNEFTEPFREPIQQVHDSVKGAIDEVKQAPGVDSAPSANGTAASVPLAASIPLAAAAPSLPSLGSSALFSPGPVLAATELPELAPTPHPETVSWMEPPPADSGAA